MKKIKNHFDLHGGSCVLYSVRLINRKSIKVKIFEKEGGNTMKNKMKKIVSLVLAATMLLAVGATAHAKVIKNNDRKTTKKQITIITDGMGYVAEWKMDKMKKGQTKTLDFNKRADRNFATEKMYFTDSQNKNCRWVFGPSGVNKAPDINYYDGTNHISLKIKNITKSGKYYTAKCNCMMYDGDNDSYRKVGTATLKFKLYPHTHYGLILKSMKLTKTVKNMWP